MPIVKEPRPLPSDLDYVPENSFAYKVSTGDTWWTLAERPDIRITGMSASDLCYYNFKTRRGSEINWYLNKKVGCQRSTRDGKNYVFTGTDLPGIIHLPRSHKPLPAHEYPAALDTRIWIGLALKSGTQNMTSGQEQLSALAMSLDHPDRWMALSATIQRPGLGVGASGGLSVVLVSGVKHPSQLHGHQQSELDFNVALGGSVGRAAKAAVAAKKYGPLITFLIKIGAKTPAGLRKALVNDPDKVADLIKLVKANKEAWGLSDTQPNVLVLDTPVGLGGELSLFYATSTYSAFALTD